MAKKKVVQKTSQKAASAKKPAARKATPALFELPSLVRSVKLATSVESVGEIMAYADGVVQASGLDDLQAGEIVDVGGKRFGLALNLGETSVGIVVLGDPMDIRVGDSVARTGRVLSVGVSDAIVGRVVGSLGESLDGREPVLVDRYMPLEKIAPGVITRQSVT